MIQIGNYWILKITEDVLREDFHYFNVKSGVYNTFKLTKLNTNSDGTNFFDLHGFEVFGQICNPVNCDILPYFTIERDNNLISDISSHLLYIFILSK